MESLEFKVSGINCEACTKLIKMDLENIPTVDQVDVKLSGEVRIQSEDKISIEAAKEALTGTQYKVIGG